MQAPGEQLTSAAGSGRVFLKVFQLLQHAVKAVSSGLYSKDPIILLANAESSTHHD